jgi:hypothetical protein
LQKAQYSESAVVKALAKKPATRSIKQTISIQKLKTVGVP